MNENPVSPSHAKRAESTRATDLQDPSAGTGLEPQQGSETREAEELTPTHFIVTTESIYLVKTKALKKINYVRQHSIMQKSNPSFKSEL